MFSVAEYNEAEDELVAEFAASEESDLMPEHEADTMDSRKCPRCTLIALKMVEIRKQREGLAN